MDSQKIEHILSFLKKVKLANKELTKKEHFKDLLHRLYHGHQEIESIIDAISSGAETTILNIPRRDRVHSGSADTLFNKIIIEFENDLSKTLKHAKEQLAGYLLGQFRSGYGYNFTLIASDFINWKVLSPDITCLDKLDDITEDEVILNEIPSASFTLSETNAEQLYYWIDRFLFKEQKQKATLKRIEEAFGYQSPVFIESFRELKNYFSEAKKYGEVQVSFEQWKKFLSIAYGSFDASENNFLIHTYLSVFAKTLAYSVVANDEFVDDNEMRGILDGSIFHRYNIHNFVDNDFFHWVKTDRSFKNLKKVFRLISQEISTFDFHNVDEDVLKGVYQELIDLDTRHSLGEYYTPDWLCEMVVREFEFKPTDRILDPSCGSGSFLRAIIHRLKAQYPDRPVEEINHQIFGIDIHPLSVQIAKTTLLISLGKDIRKAKKPIHLNIILANTLLAPEGVKNLFGGELVMQIDKKKLSLNTQVLEDVNLFDEALDICDDLAEQTQNKSVEERKTFENILNKKYKQGGLSPGIIDSFYKIYTGLKFVKEQGRDSIWKFIIQNLYKPYFLYKKFDYIIGNPPWFTFSSVRNEEYQNILDSLAVKYDLKPAKTANFPHLEIAAIFLGYCSNYFLKDSGKLAFVLPRSFFNGEQHDNTRKGTAKGFKLTAIWDLCEVSPLFRVPSCVLFAETSKGKKGLPASGLKGKTIRGNLPAHNCSYEKALPKIIVEDSIWYYIQQGKSSAFSNKKTKSVSEINSYKNLFKQGATIVPRSFYFVELTQEAPPDFDDRIVSIKTADAIKSDAKAPWKDIKLEGRIESRFLFRTAISRSILPFYLYKPELVVLPIEVKINELGQKKIFLLNVDKLRREGYLNAAKWFFNVQNIWEIYRTEKNQTNSAEMYLNWQNKLTELNLNCQYVVLYNSSAKDANATVLCQHDLDLPFIVDHKAYWFGTDKKEEAYYLVGILNSTIPNAMMKDFQSKGLFGARDVHKKILDIYFPKFEETNSDHLLLASLSKKCHETASNFISVNQPKENLTTNSLGRFRLEIKKAVSEEMKQIDKLVKKLISGR